MGILSDIAKLFCPTGRGTLLDAEHRRLLRLLDRMDTENAELRSVVDYKDQQLSDLRGELVRSRADYAKAFQRRRDPQGRFTKKAAAAAASFSVGDAI